MNHRTKYSQLLIILCLIVASSAFVGAPAQKSPATPMQTKPQSGQAYGIYPGVVISRPDPHMRVQVEIPSLNIRGEWALPCVPVGSTAVPPLQSSVWVMFEGGDTHRPVWIGVFPVSVSPAK